MRRDDDVTPGMGLAMVAAGLALAWLALWVGDVIATWRIR
jgi:hypothetical protein